MYLCYMAKKKQIKNIEDNRYGLFMTENSFNLDIMYGRNYLETDNSQEIVLHRVNLIETQSHSLYGQAKSSDKVFMTPVPLKVMLSVTDADQEYYGGYLGGIGRDDTGNLVFGIYLEELKEKQTEINKGDIVGFNFSGEKNRYYEVENANNITDETSKSIGGFKPYWKRVSAVPVKEDVVPFLNETKE